MAPRPGARPRVALAGTRRPAAVWVDTLTPGVQFTLSGRQRHGSTLRLAVRATDAPILGEIGSGVASVEVRWGDGH